METPSPDLLRAFGLTGGDDPEFIDAWHNACAQARAAWPTVQLDLGAFACVIFERAEEGACARSHLAQVHVVDLFLVCACLEQIPEAIQLLDTHFVRRLARELRGGGLAPYVEEAEQLLRVRLLVAKGDEAPRLAGYRGRGPLMAWLRLTMTRLALNVRQASARDHTLDAELLEASQAVDDPELSFLRRHYKREITAAMTEAFESAPMEERTMLRMHFLDGLSATQIGALFSLSGRTVHRRIAEARVGILTRTRNGLRQQLRLSATQLATIMRLCEADLELSLGRLLSGRARSA